MKRQFVHILLLALCYSVAASCSKSDDPELDPDSGGVGQSQTLQLTPVGKLNQGTPVINSHADVTARSSLKMDYRSYVEIGSSQVQVAAPVYPRVKKMANGRYILFYHNNQIGADSYYVRSSDLLTWTGGDRVFARYSIIDQSGASNERRFSNCNGLVLANGDVLAVASYRANANYKTLKKDNGLILRRSTDNGETWSNPVEIYQGTNWEPHLLQLPSGEIHCYFTESRTDIADYNSGVGLIISNDNGYTWTPSFGNEPYRVIRKKFGEKDGVGLFTDQMPGVIKLNNSNQLVAALETYYDGVYYHISMAYSDNNGQWPHLTINEEGPADRHNFIYLGAAPSLAQFPSGETLLSYNASSRFTLRLGDATARTFGEAYDPFPKTGYWGTLEPIDAHQIIGSMHTSGALMLARFILNHRIVATHRTVNVDGNNSEWSTTDDALFVGEKSQAQATLRCSCDNDNIYFLVEVLDQAISQDDDVNIFLSPITATGDLNSDARRIKVAYSGLKSTDIYAGGWRTTDMNVSVKGAYDGTLSDNSDSDNGYLIEIAIPRSQLNLSSGTLLVNFALFDSQGGEDAICNTASKSLATWIPISGL
ncbi:MAG: hypothetical protein LBR67_08350 [Dysgonamonadaceae bacterium]|jgi:hypothetical protein|nr:hypothetical protein [Dysgonamonadaceae bacterium]